MQFIEKVVLPSGTIIELFETSKTYGASSKAPGQKIIVASATLPDQRLLEGILSSALVAEKGSNTWAQFIQSLKEAGKPLNWGKLQFDDGAQLKLFFAAKERTQTQIAVVTL